MHWLQIVNVLGFRLPQYKSPTLLLSLGLSVRVFWHLIMTRPDVIHVSSPGLLVFAGILYAKLLDLPLVVSYHTHVPGKCPLSAVHLSNPMYSANIDIVLATSKLMLSPVLCPCKSRYLSIYTLVYEISDV